MAEGQNIWIGIGNLGQEAELRFTQSQQPVLTFRIACSEGYFDKNSNERKERTEWVTCVLWGKRGEALSKILHKGSRVSVTGRLQTRSWEDKQGGKRYATEINVQNVVLLDGKGNGRGRQDDAGDHDGGYDHSQDAGGDFDGDQIPF